MVGLRTVMQIDDWGGLCTTVIMPKLSQVGRFSTYQPTYLCMYLPTRFPSYLPTYLSTYPINRRCMNGTQGRHRFYPLMDRPWVYLPTYLSTYPYQQAVHE